MKRVDDYATDYDQADTETSVMRLHEERERLEIALRELIDAERFAESIDQTKGRL